jgi:hypothetical protein
MDSLLRLRAMNGLAEFLTAQYDADEAAQYVLTQRYLADLAAKRAIVALHYRGWTGGCATCAYEAEDLGEDQFQMQLDWPCPTLLALAQPYRDAPGFRDEWKVET